MKREDITNLFPEATQSQIDTLMGINGNDINNARGSADTLKSQVATQAAELERLKTQTAGIEALTTERDNYKSQLEELQSANALREMREKVSKETGVPVDLITGDNEETCKTQAQGILNFSNSNGYPKVKDGGEVGNVNKKTTRQQFFEWFNQIER